MSFTPDRIGSAEWNRFPRIETLVDPNHTDHPERLPHGKIVKDQMLGRTTSPSGIFSGELLESFQRKGLILHVACGVNTRETSLGYSTPVGILANAYGVEPLLEYMSGNGIDGRTLTSYPEDLPFRDHTFEMSLAMRMGVGWMADVAFDSYWSVREMVRVTQPGGIALIGLGSGVAGGVYRRTEGIGAAYLQDNVRRISEAISRLQEEDLGRDRIAIVSDFSDRPAPQISIRVR